MKKAILAIFLILSVFAIPAQGTVESHQTIQAPESETPDLDDPLGREVARHGTEGTLTGNLRFDKGEWFLVTPEITYEMHMGPAGHDTDDLFVQDSFASVRGFIYKDHIAPILIESTTGDVSFWHEGRYPLWAGGGNRDQQVDQAYLQRVTVQGERGNPALFQRNLMQREQE